MIGILALQGGFLEHEAILDFLSLPHKRVTGLKDTGDLTGLIIPGGESTVMDLFIEKYGLQGWLQNVPPEFPVYGTCAGLILLSRYGLLDVEVERNAYGRQSASFMAEMQLQNGEKMKGHFIRAPKITRVGEGVEVLAEYEGSPVFVRQKNIWGSSFHPELAGETVLHAGIFSC